MMKSPAIYIALTALLAVMPIGVSGAVLESDNFKVLDPVISIGGGTKSTSTNFSLIQTFGEPAVGTSTITNFQIFSGFLWYPAVTAPSSVSASAGDGTVDLSWNASSATGGWSVGGYSVGQSTASGGPYSYSSVGNVTSTSVSSLSNGTTYFFVVVTEDAFGDHIATSTEVSATPAAAEEETEESSGGGGGGVSGLITTIQNFFQAQTDEEGEEAPAEPVDSRFDINKDQRISIADISVLFYCWDTEEGPLPSEEEQEQCRGKADFNQDEHINIADLSIFLFHVGSHFG